MDTTPTADQSVYPTIEVVVRDGQPIWQVSGAGMVVHAHAGHKALERYWALCRTNGLDVPQ